jgi:transcription termination factor Rho
MRDGSGVLRANALAGRDDPLVPVAMVRDNGLRPGDLVEGVARGRRLQRVTKVNGHEPENLAARPRFEDLTAVHPDTPVILGPTPTAITGRLLDLIAPVGRGQRGLIVAPPKAGKTTILKEIARGVAADASLDLVAILVAERPEEATELRRAIHGTVLAADLDMPGEDHIRVATLGVEYAKRLAEEGRHVVVLIDSLTRLARAHNLSGRGTGRSLSGGIDAGALQPVRQVFGSARATEEAGSVTILATALVDTGSRLDDLVYEEFKGTGNMEVHLDRELAQKRLFPAVNIGRSSTRREELLLDAETLARVTSLRRKLHGVPADEALTALLQALHKGAQGNGPTPRGGDN